MKKIVCYIGNSESTCNFIAKQLMKFLGAYIEVKVWCLQHEDILPYPTCDIYVAASSTILQVVKSQLPPHKHYLVAERIINSEHLDKLLELAPGTRAIVVGIWEEAALSTINIIKKLGFSFLDLIPYYPGCEMEQRGLLPEDIACAITPGVDYLVPRRIKKVIDIGARSIDISTFAQLIQLLKLPMTLINEISHYYIQAILNLSINQYKMAAQNNELKHKMEVILNTVDEAIVAVNEKNKIIVFNPVAQKLLEINWIQAFDRDATEVIPQVDFLACIHTEEGIANEIKRINGSYYIVSTNPFRDESGFAKGAVATFRPVVQVKDLEAKVRRELKNNCNVAKATFSHIVGHSGILISALTQAKKFARTDLTILLQGESGTGKELFAEAIHNYSERKEGPFVAINFAALPQNLVESELFGYDDGAFTGAKKGGKAGLFEEAHLGTIFLDEIGDASLEVQKRLLRVLEEKKVRRVGSNMLTPVDVRVIAATNQNLELLISEGKFREDLFYRLCALPITIPPLSARGEDVFVLINYFTQKAYNRELVFEPPLKNFLLDYRWPGNIRELQNVAKYLCSIIGPDETATIRHIPPYMIRNMEKRPVREKISPICETNNEQIMIQLQKQELLKPVVFILTEVSKVSFLNKGIGRQSLQRALHNCGEDFADHKVRQLLKILEEMGYVQAGKTRQGSKITREGELFLSYIKENELAGK
ncbi:MAG: sigma 54-interacting transcriptional regulator [Peptococcaceae bacterium]|nr:sigma 54-interacting transcriptional regulator [Peptococcaceae bacterium]